MGKRLLILVEDTEENCVTLGVILKAAAGSPADILYRGSLVNAEALEDYGCRRLPEYKETDIYKYPQLLVLDPSLKLLSCIANIIVNDTISEIIYKAVVLGKTIVLPRLEENRNCRDLPESLKEKAKEFMKKAELLGIQILDAKGLKEIDCRRKALLTERDIKKLSDVQRIRVSTDTKLTPLAADQLKERDIQLIRE